MLKEPTRVALSTDIWTSIETQAYITVTTFYFAELEIKYIFASNDLFSEKS